MTGNRDPSLPSDSSVRRFTDDLVGAALAGGYDDVAEALGVLARAESARVAAAVVGELVSRCTGAVRAHQRTQADALFTVVVENEQGESASVERLPRGPRAALRAVLAALNDDEASRDIHVGLAAGGSPADLVGVLSHLLVWLVELSATSAAEFPLLSCFAD
ncbi:hypothetical protein [Amycolatopsis vancoresmycina]|uniref:Uncharacterized protein n=1 Tax=Amycolatopsis vancoresmycina DSM 44592 TaxID=1292037 RepID=R1I3V3_9PSEU|nr:hypothetical protein [Amycolatopsis vancoresmycina]EOD65159.1 hypothetical protein H480_28196 [Amycolatopsis vancoresmycina DSM 44592]